jgi:nitrogen fixation-related uncharacterized protein
MTLERVSLRVPLAGCALTLIAVIVLGFLWEVLVGPP